MTGLYINPQICSYLALFRSFKEVLTKLSDASKVDEKVINSALNWCGRFKESEKKGETRFQDLTRYSTNKKGMSTRIDRYVFLLGYDNE